MALATRSLKCQVIDASSSGSTNVSHPPYILAEVASPAVALAEQHKQEVDDSDNIFLCHGPWSPLEDRRCVPRFGASCGVTMWMKCVGQHSTIGCCHFHPIC